ncbi:MAG TPA: 3-deoxy-manno-octulosonate cytidylyltransferase [Candidatus Binatia bacterium]|jgi:3-deoxy-manno-octulosonate cytidylyltransferase (CMP-KDO synthetase)|nr:3-deoxy-manno-octulosonate cytidylyltransferase [Candidatus Binatia bacterium]
MSVVAIIPARYGSTRLPGKPLADIGGKPMIQHVYESASKARELDRVVVATDDRRVEQAVRSFGGEVMMTSKHHASGTDRLAEVARKIRADWLVNVQGDLPFIRSDTIVRAIRPLRRDRTIPMGTVCTAIYEEEEWRNANIVKVLTDRAGFALYFSRSPIPYVRNSVIDPYHKKMRAARRVWGYRHLGLYVYRRDFLLKFARLRPTALEQIESLEQLRALENGYRIYVAEVDESGVEVDTPADLKKAERYLKAQLN